LASRASFLTIRARLAILPYEPGAAQQIDPMIALPAISLAAALAGLERLGHAPEALLEQTGLSPEQLAEPFAVVPDTAFVAVWTAAFAADPDPALPLRAGLATPFGAFGVLDHLVGASHSIGEAMQTLALFFRLVSATVSLELRHDDGDSVWLVNTPPALSDAVSDSWTLAIILGRMRSVAPAFGVRLVALTQSQSLAESASTLLQAPVACGQARAGLLLAAEAWRAPLDTANPALFATLRALAERADVRAFTEDPLRQRLADELDSAIEAGFCSARGAARWARSPTTSATASRAPSTAPSSAGPG
jgi:hypothetical protein